MLTYQDRVHRIHPALFFGKGYARTLSAVSDRVGDICLLQFDTNFSWRFLISLEGCFVEVLDRECLRRLEAGSSVESFERNSLDDCDAPILGWVRPDVDGSGKELRSTSDLADWWRGVPLNQT